MARQPSSNGAAWVAAPPVILGGFCVVLIGLGLFDANPFWPRTDLTFAEAAALRDRGTVALMLESGRDPSRRYPIRAGLISSDSLTATPMEAAIQEDRSEIVSFLLQYGSSSTDVSTVCEWLRLSKLRKSELIDSLVRSRFPQESAQCPAAALPKETT